MTTETERTDLQPPPLLRSRDHKIIAGVAAGVARRFEIDTNLVRAGFVVLTFAWGFGAALYLTLWALVPEEPDAFGEIGARSQGRRARLLTAALLLVAVGIGLAGFSALFGGRPPIVGSGVFWDIVVIGLFAVLVVRSSAHLALGRMVLAIALVAGGAFVVVGGIFAGLVASSGVPFSASVGNRIVQPTSEGGVAHNYHLGAGNLTLDLTGVHFNGRPLTVHASVGVGRLLVELPRGVRATVDAQTGVGTVHDPFGTSNLHPSKSVLVLDATVGVGDIEIADGAAYQVAGTASSVLRKTSMFAKVPEPQVAPAA